MTTNMDAHVTYWMAIDRRSGLLAEAAARRSAHDIDQRTGEPLPPTRGPLATLRRRLVGTTSFAWVAP